MGDPSNITGTTSTQEAPVTFTADPVTKHEYVADQVIVRFKSQNTGGPSISNDKIRMAHAKVGAKVKKDFSAEGIIRATGCATAKWDRCTIRDQGIPVKS